MPPTPPEPTLNPSTAKSCPWYRPLCRVSLTSRLLTGFVILVLPFVGGYVGYTLSPDKVVEVPVIQNSIPNNTNTLSEPNWLTADLKSATDFRISTSSRYTFAAYISDLDFKNGTITVVPLKITIGQGPDDYGPGVMRSVGTTTLTLPIAKPNDYVNNGTSLMNYIFTWPGTQELAKPDWGSFMVDFEEARKITKTPVDSRGEFYGYVRYITVSSEGRVIQIDTQFEP